MRELIKDLISKKPDYLEGKVTDNGVRITAGYVPSYMKIEFLIDESDFVKEFLHVDCNGGKSVLFGESIETHHLIMQELNIVLHEEIINYKNQIS